MKLSSDDTRYLSRSRPLDNHIYSHSTHSPFQNPAILLFHQSTCLQLPIQSILLLATYTTPNLHHLHQVHSYHNPNRTELFLDQRKNLNTEKLNFLFHYLHAQQHTIDQYRPNILPLANAPFWWNEIAIIIRELVKTKPAFILQALSFNSSTN